MNKFSGSAEREQVARKAREEVAKRHYEHAIQTGNSKASFEKIYKHVDERASIVDKKNNR